MDLLDRTFSVARTLLVPVERMHKIEKLWQIKFILIQRYIEAHWSGHNGVICRN